MAAKLSLVPCLVALHYLERMICPFPEIPSDIQNDIANLVANFILRHPSVNLLAKIPHLTLIDPPRIMPIQIPTYILADSQWNRILLTMSYELYAMSLF